MAALIQAEDARGSLQQQGTFDRREGAEELGPRSTVEPPAGTSANCRQMSHVAAEANAALAASTVTESSMPVPPTECRTRKVARTLVPQPEAPRADECVPRVPLLDGSATCLPMPRVGLQRHSQQQERQGCGPPSSAWLRHCLRRSVRCEMAPVACASGTLRRLHRNCQRSSCFRMAPTAAHAGHGRVPHPTRGASDCPSRASVAGERRLPRAASHSVSRTPAHASPLCS